MEEREYAGQIKEAMGNNAWNCLSYRPSIFSRIGFRRRLVSKYWKHNRPVKDGKVKCCWNLLRTGPVSPPAARRVPASRVSKQDQRQPARGLGG
jgi:hypothetical protein